MTISPNLTVQLSKESQWKPGSNELILREFLLQDAKVTIWLDLNRAKLHKKWINTITVVGQITDFQ